MKCYVLKNEKGEFFSSRSGKCTAEFNPFSHLYKVKDSIDYNMNNYDNFSLHIEEVEIGIINSVVL